MSKPTSSNKNKENCSPVSSNCIIWQGEDLPCINLCNGDSISEVVYKLAVELCNLKTEIDLSDIDLTCLLGITSQICDSVVEPEKTISNIITLLINRVCCLSDIVAAIDTSGSEEIEISIEQCFKPFINNQGQTVSTLPHSEYTIAIAKKLCTLAATVASHTNILNNHETRITDLENDSGYVEPTPTPTYILTPGTPQDLEVFVEELENQFGQYAQTLGQISDLVSAQGQSTSCGSLNSSVPLSTGVGTMSSLAGWQTSVTNLAQSLRNMWITICDIRGAVRTILDTCCKVGCGDITVDFDVKRTLNDDGDFVLLLFFGQKTILPSTWYDCDQTTNPYTEYGFTGNTLTITDSTGHQYTAYVQLRSQDLTTGVLMDPSALNVGLEINLSTSPIDPLLDIVITSNICVTDGSTSCVKCLTKDIPYTNISCCTITATDTVTVTYQVCDSTPTTTTTTIAP